MRFCTLTKVSLISRMRSRRYPKVSIFSWKRSCSGTEVLNVKLMTFLALPKVWKMKCKGYCICTNRRITSCCYFQHVAIIILYTGHYKFKKNSTLKIIYLSIRHQNILFIPEIYYTMKCKVISIVVIVCASLIVIISSARHIYNIIAIKYPINILKTMLYRIGVMQHGFTY